VGTARTAVTPVERRAAHAAAQPGYLGQTLAMTATPDTIITPHRRQCAHCGAALAAVMRGQIHHLPPLALAMTEHRAATIRCSHC